MPKVSIITPAFNSAGFIAQTIESILDQTFRDWEMIVVDDASTDGTSDVVKRYSEGDGRIRLFRLPVNSGAAAARNKAISEASGRYIAFCDSDDRWMPEKLERHLHFIEEKGAAFSYTSYLDCDEAGNLRNRVAIRPVETFRTVLRDCRIGCLTIIYDTQMLGGKVYLPELRNREDFAMDLKILEKCGCAYGLDEPLSIYRHRKGSLSSNKLSILRYYIVIYREQLHWSRIRSLAFLLFVFLPSTLCKKLSGGKITSR